ncbi:MAG: aldehyde dehydrogenase family protein, partial [Candidatus Dadabacteria bacterium]
MARGNTMLQTPESFKNEPPLDFTIESNRLSFGGALKRVKAEIEAQKFKAAPIIAGKELSGSETIASIDPSDGTTTVASVELASTEQAEAALKSLSEGSSGWEALSFEKRAEIIERAGELMRKDRLRLAATIVYEAAKPWKEADADVCEAIDFCFYYAAEMRRLGPPQVTDQVMGEQNIYFYQPRGVAVVISPWNFPLAISCGMTVAALVTGNATVLKPAEQTSYIAYEFAKILLEAGVPQDAFAFLPGRGEVIGRHLVNSPLTDLICFTGSKAVGLEIIKNAATVHPGQKNIKRVITELGGKNAIIIDEDADLDEAIKGVLYSAFGFSGQKCSACSRVIVVGDAYQVFLERITEAASDLIIGPADDPATYFGPVIDEESQKRILKTIDSAKSGSTVAFEGQAPSPGYYVPAVIFKDVDHSTSLWREEIFGPVLAVSPAKDFEEALKTANDSAYALTGGLYSRSPAHIEQATRQFKVGNLYINRGCTGAI